MGINIRQKGAEGERQVASALNAVIRKVLIDLGWPDAETTAAKWVQRNQNQSAVGGSDLSNVFGLAIEVKRQEALSVNTWWQQCITAAARNQELPVLVYRQNNKAWRVVMYLQNPLPNVSLGTALQKCAPHASKTVRGEIGWEDFLSWFELWVTRKIMNGEVPRE